MSYTSIDKIHLSADAIKAAAKAIRTAIQASQGAADVSMAAVLAAMQRDAVFHFPIAEPSRGKLTLLLGNVRSGHGKLMELLMREAMRCGRRVVLVTSGHKDFHRNLDNSLAWYWGAAATDPRPFGGLLGDPPNYKDMPYKSAVIEVDPPFRVCDDPMKQVAPVLLDIDEIIPTTMIFYQVNSSITEATIAPLRAKGIDIIYAEYGRLSCPHWILEEADEIIAGPALPQEEVFPVQLGLNYGEVAILRGQNTGLVGALPGIDLLDADPVRPGWSIQSKKLRENIKKHLDARIPAKHIEYLELVSRSAGFRSWHAASGSKSTSADWTKF